jgi:beta-lactamase family protein
MRGIRRPRRAMLTAAACAAVLGAASAVPLAAATATSAAATTSICTSAKHPFIAAKISAAISAAVKARPGSFVAMAASDPTDGLNCQLNNTNHFYAASVMKVTILSALLMKVGGPSHLTAAQKNLAVLMITQSDNSAAQTLWTEEGIPAVQTFLNKASMSETQLNSAWGLTRITAHDELRLLQVLTNSTVLSSGSRGYVLTLMSEVIASQRWGISAGASSAEKLHIKNGWLNYPSANDWNINSIGTFTGPRSYEIVVLAAPASLSGGQTETYGIDTVKDAAYPFNRDLALWGHF